MPSFAGLVPVRFLEALENRAFSALLAAQVVSQAGDWIYSLALSWTVYRMTGSGASMAVVLLSGRLPVLLLALLGGVAADRIPRRTVLILADLIRAATIGWIALSAARGSMHIWQLAVNAAVFGAAGAFFQPALRALVTETVTPAARQSANALLFSVSHVTTLFGMVMGGLVVGTLGAQGAFALDAFSFLLSALFLRLIPASTGQPARNRSVWADLSRGTAYVRQYPVIAIGLAVMGVFGLTGEAANVVLVPWVATIHLHGNPVILSVTWICFSLGGLLATMTLGSMRKLNRRGFVAYASVAAAGAAVGLSGLASFPWELWGAQFVVGAGAMVYGVVWEGLLQDLVPADDFGKVASIEQMVGTALFPIGLSLMGFLSSTVGEQAVMVAGGVLTVLVALATLAFHEVRSLE